MNLLVAVAICGAVFGCGAEQRGGPRIETTPITGKVLVDGQPAGLLLVKCIPTGEAKVPTNVSGFTDPEGNFSIGTYEAGDGAPEGEYTLVFEWGQYGLSGRYGPPDKLKGAYLKPEQSQWSVIVAPGAPADVGTIELTTPK